MLVDATQASDSKGTVDPVSSRILMAASLVPQWRIMVTMGTCPARGSGGPLPGGKVRALFMIYLSSVCALRFDDVPALRCRSAFAGKVDLSKNPTSRRWCLILQLPISSSGLPLFLPF